MNLFFVIMLKSVVVSALIVLIWLCTRRQSAMRQSTVLHLGLALLMAMPVLALVFHVAGVGLSFASAQEVRASEDIRVMTGPMLQSPLEVGNIATPTLQTLWRSTVMAWMLSAVLLTAWLIPAAWRLLCLVGSHWNLRRLLDRSTDITDAQIIGRLNRILATHASTQMNVRLLFSAEIQCPLSVGLGRPSILLDQKTIQHKAHLDAILTHELAHLKARDSMRIYLCNIAMALFWFNPVVWFLTRQAALLREAAADEAVLGTGHAPIGYAQLLAIHAKASMQASFPLAHAMAQGNTELKTRIRRILNYQTPRRPNKITSVGLLAVGLIVPMLVAAYGDAAPPAKVSSSGRALANQVLKRNLEISIPAGSDRAGVTIMRILENKLMQKAKALFPKLDAAIPDEMLVLRYASSVDDLAAMSASGFQPPRFNDLFLAGSLGLHSEFLNRAMQHGCTENSLDELMALAAMEVDLDQIQVRDHRCDVWPRP